MPGQEFREVFHVALVKYQEITGKRLEDANVADIRDTDDLIEAIETQNEHFEEFRARGHAFTTVLKYAVLPLETVGNMVAGAASAAFPPSSMIFGAVIYLVKAAKGVSNRLDAIAELLDKLKDFSIRLKVYFKAALSTELYTKLVQIMVTVIEIFARSTKTIKGGFGSRIGTLTRNILLGNTTDMQSLVAKLDKLTVSEARLVGAETLVETKETGAGVKDIQASMTTQSAQLHQLVDTSDRAAKGTDNMVHGIDRMASAMEQSQSQAQEEVRQRDLNAVKEALGPSNTYLERYLQIERTRMAGSGEWIYSEDALKKWVESAVEPILWVYGNPGSGKSFLAFNIVTYVGRLTQGHATPSMTEDASVAFFYFRDNDVTTRSVHQALKDVAYQLTVSDPAYEKYVMMTAPNEKDVSSIRVAWKKLFADYWLRPERGSDRAYIVFDGLDEANDEDRETLFELLADLHEAGENCRLQVAMTGRPHVMEEIQLALGNPLLIAVDASKNSADIVSYIKTSVKKSRVLNHVSKELKEKVISTLTSKAGGMFMWVNLMIAELSKKSKPSAIERALEDAPRGLKDMLVHVLEGFSERLDEEEASDLNDLLMWVCLATRPLRLGELDAMLRLKSEEGEPDLLLESKLRQQFASFFTLTREDALTTADLMAQKGESDDYDDDDAIAGAEDDEEGTDDVEHQTDFNSHPNTTYVAFSHASISDFFTSPGQGMVAKPGRPEVGVEQQLADQQITLRCIDILMDEDFRKRMEGAYSLETYARENWLDHLKTIDTTTMIPSAFSEVGTKLIRAMSVPEKITNFTFSFNWQVFSQANAELLATWTKDPHVTGASDEDTAWLDSVPVKGLGALEFFAPALHQTAVRWLAPGQKDFWNVQACPTIIFSWLLRKEDKLEDTETPPALSVEDILTAGRWAKLEEDAGWHQRMAMTFRDLNHQDEAAQWFTKALELEPKFWNARSGLGYLRMKQGKYQEAIELDSQALEDAENDTTGDATFVKNGRATCLKRIAENYRSLAREISDNITPESLELDQKSFEHYRRSFEVNFTDFQLVTDCLNHLDSVASMTLPWGSNKVDPEKVDVSKVPTSLSTFEIVMSIAAELWENKDDKGIPSFVKYMMSEPAVRYPFEDVYRIFAVAAQQTGKVAWLQKIYRESVGICQRERETVTATELVVCLSMLYWNFSTGVDDEERALHMMERLSCEKSVAMRIETEIQLLRRLSLAAVGSMCLYMALEYPTRQDYWIHKVERIVARTVRRNTNLSEDALPASDIMLFLSPWYMRQGRQAEARDLIRPLVKDALKMLSDDDPENDREAIMQLSYSLFSVNDDLNGLALLRTLRPYQNGNAMLRPDDAPSEGTYIFKKPKTGDAPNPDEVEAEPASVDTKLDEPTSGDQDATAMPQSAQADNEETQEATGDDAEEQDGEEDDPEEIFTWSCDGLCNRNFNNCDGVVVCRYDNNTYCEICYKLWQEDRLPIKTCGKSHEFFTWPVLKTPFKQGQIIVGDKILQMEEWKQNLRVQWGL